MKAAATAIAVLTLSAAPSQAYVIGGRAWPKGTVTYYPQARGYAAPVTRAARMLNRAGVGVTLRKASSRSAADVVVAYGGNACEGSALVGYERVSSDLMYLGRGCSNAPVTLTAVHEFGHGLGLQHQNRVCARM